MDNEEPETKCCGDGGFSEDEGGVDSRQDGEERKRCGGDGDQEGAAMSAVEAVTFFLGCGGQMARVQQTVRGIDHPDGQEGREHERSRVADVKGASYEAGPQSRNCRGIEREQMPTRKDAGRGVGSLKWCG